jgi:down-regulator of transcription 1
VAGTIVRLAQDLLPEDLNLSDDTHNLIQACALEFIQLLTFQANEICQRESRNGFLGLQHVVRACQELGFQEYVCEIEAVSAVFEKQVKFLQKVCAAETKGNGVLEEGGQGGLVD